MRNYFYLSFIRVFSLVYFLEDGCLGKDFKAYQIGRNIASRALLSEGGLEIWVCLFQISLPVHHEANNLFSIGYPPHIKMGNLYTPPYLLIFPLSWE